MERFCESCGSLINASAAVCPFCGAQQDVIPSEYTTPRSTSGTSVMQGAAGAAGSSSSAQGGYIPYYDEKPPAENAPANLQTADMTFGKWLGTIIVTNFLGLISLVLLLVWGFGKNATEPRKSYCRASLCIFPLTSVASALMLLLLVGIILEANGY